MINLVFKSKIDYFEKISIGFGNWFQNVILMQNSCELRQRAYKFRKKQKIQ